LKQLKGKIDMKKIMLVCAAGMSTSMLVSRMKKSLEQTNQKIDVFAKAEPEALSMIDQVDVILLGPQVSYMLSDFEEAATPYQVPVRIINAQDYGRMDGEKVLSDAYKLLENHS